MDIDQQASTLHKKLEQIKFKLDNPDLSANKRKQLEDQVDAINAQLKAFEQQLTQLRVTQIIDLLTFYLQIILGIKNASSWVFQFYSSTF